MLLRLVPALLVEADARIESGVQSLSNANKDRPGSAPREREVTPLRAPPDQRYSIKPTSRLCRSPRTATSREACSGEALLSR